MDDDFDRLRQKSARTSASQTDIDDFDDEGGLLGRFSPIQRLILAVLLLLNIIVIGFVLMVITGVISL